ncbi:DUF523 domain-containing protein [Saccharobesus litoralis]|uniref:DUF523 domain-containing protein n=1 Tax=Saccharobesus litoralis TaxID=2172099 RepID=A0A2S0VQT7_9ALTE|nr:DUF523 domain-containing protein [Saccharobesus litoralis]AWB66559.1 DUF523 domain-containing protein [Saccharobesus litoralis]
MTSKVLVSACLLGQPVRYDGQAKPVHHPFLETLQQRNLIIPFCPECAGGLPTPRPAAEIQPDGSVKTQRGGDVSAQFQLGAELALKLCQQNAIQFAILKESSPSCGSNWIYDGNFSAVKIAGKGLTAKLLSQHGIKVFSEENLQQLMLEMNLMK